MKQGIDLEQHFCLNAANSVGHICSPLFNYLDVDYFCFVSIDLKTQQRFFLTNRPDWLRHFYKNGLYNDKVIMRAEHFQHFTNYAWSDFQADRPFIEGKLFEINSGVTVINSNREHVNVYCFGSKKELSSHYFLNSLDYFHRFIGYFHDQGSGLIKDAMNHQFILPDYGADSQKLILESEEKFANFFSKTELSRIVIDNFGTYLTRQEALCTYLLIHGETAKTIARVLNISNRTVEKHLSCVKEKLGCVNIASLIGQMLQSCFINQFLSYAKNELKRVVQANIII